MKVVQRKGLGFIVLFTTICSVVELLVRGIDLSRFKDVIYHLIGSGDSLILIYISLSMFLYYVVYLKYRENRGFDDYEKKPEFTEILLFEGKLKGDEISPKLPYSLSFKYTGEIFQSVSGPVRKSEVIPEEDIDTKTRLRRDGQGNAMDDNSEAYLNALDKRDVQRKVSRYLKSAEQYLDNVCIGKFP